MYTQQCPFIYIYTIPTQIPATMLEVIHGSKFPKLHRTSMKTGIHYTRPHCPPPSKQMF